MKMDRDDFEVLRDARELLSIAQRLLWSVASRGMGTDGKLAGPVRVEAVLAHTTAQTAQAIICEGCGIGDFDTYIDYIDPDNNL